MDTSGRGVRCTRLTRITQLKDKRVDEQDSMVNSEVVILLNTKGRTKTKTTEGCLGGQHPPPPTLRFVGSSHKGAKKVGAPREGFKGKEREEL